MISKVRYVAETTAARFHKSTRFVRGLKGPIGSGKSVACLWEIIFRAMSQAPNDEGVRQTRFAVVRNTYPELRTTTIKTFQEWVPETTFKITFGAPITARANILLNDGTRVESEILFISLDKEQDTKKLLSMELTGCWINEARELSHSMIIDIISRVGRYPAVRSGVRPSWSGVIMDTNPPDDLHWWYRLAEEKTPDGWEFFNQPPVFLSRGKAYLENPDAENVQNQPLRFDYWRRMLSGATKQWINAYVMGKYGVVLAGRPVYEHSYDDDTHVAKGLTLAPGNDIIAGADFGLTPAVVIAQITRNGRIEILYEIHRVNIGVRKFFEDDVLPFISKELPHASIRWVGDTTGGNRAEHDARSSFDELDELGVDMEPCWTNEPAARVEAVNYYLNLSDRGKPKLLIDERCKMLRKGFVSEYKFRKLAVSGPDRYSDKPEKNEFSHIHDALQYICATVRGQPAKSARRSRVNVQTSMPAIAWT